MSRKAELSENILASQLERFLTWAIERRIQILISLGVAVAAILIGSVFVLRQREQHEQADASLGYAQALVSQQKYADAEKALAELRKGGLDGDGQRLAAFLSAAAAYGLGNVDEAIKYYSEAIDRSGGHPIRPLARAGLGTALEQKKDFTAAIGNYSAFLSETPNHFLAPRIQLALGRSQLMAGNQDDARKALESLIDQYPTSEWAENARRLMDKNKPR